MTASKSNFIVGALWFVALGTWITVIVNELLLWQFSIMTPLALIICIISVRAGIYYLGTAYNDAHCDGMLAQLSDKLQKSFEEFDEEVDEAEKKYSTPATTECRSALNEAQK